MKQLSVFIAAICLSSAIFAESFVDISIEPMYNTQMPCLANNMACSIVLSSSQDIVDVVITNNSKTTAAQSIIVVEAPPQDSSNFVFGTFPNPPFPFDEFTIVVYDLSTIDPTFQPTPCFQLPDFKLPPSQKCSLRFSASPGAALGGPSLIHIKGTNTKAIAATLQVVE